MSRLAPRHSVSSTLRIRCRLDDCRGAVWITWLKDLAKSCSRAFSSGSESDLAWNKMEKYLKFQLIVLYLKLCCLLRLILLFSNSVKHSSMIKPFLKFYGFQISAYLQQKWLLSYSQFYDFSLNKSFKTYLEPMLPSVTCIINMWWL